MPTVTGDDDPSSGGSRGEWEGFILSGTAFRASLLCGAVWSEKSRDVSTRNRGRRLLSRAAPRDNKLRIRTEVRGVPAANDLLTSAFKEREPIPQFRATAKLGEFVEARFSQAF